MNENIPLQPANPMYAYVGAFVDELQRVNVQHVVICPGSRSTPLALAFAGQFKIRTWMHVDERSAAFFALGLAKRLQQPVALVCTSGTAAANFFPAIVEAHLTHVPLLVLTADRPHELRDNGAPQSIDQNRLYGTYTKWFVEMALPEATNAALRYVRTIADRAVAQAQAMPVGPVHLNFPFREPLTPGLLVDQPLPPENQRDSSAWYGRPDNTPYTWVWNTAMFQADYDAYIEAAKIIHNAKRGVIIVGPIQDTEDLPSSLHQLADYLGYPILADPLSQLRCGEHDQTSILSSYDAFLRNEDFLARVEPEVILRFGAMPTSKPVLLYMKRYAECPQIIIDDQQSWQEPTQLASAYIHAAPTLACQALINALQDVERNEDVAYEMDVQWLTLWQHADQVTQQALEATMHDFSELFEGWVFSELASLLPEESILYVGNSMPVRDLDTFFWKSQRSIHIMGNRGANGIDGVISSALGASAATGEPTVLVIGDLSFYHDLNGLLAAKLYQLNLVIVLVNNDGGGIFSFLPQAAHPTHFEQVFGTPTGLDFQPVVQIYGGTFTHVENWQEFRIAIEYGLKNGGLHVVEVKTERGSNVIMHRQLWQAVGKALQS